MIHNRPLASVFLGDDEGGWAERSGEPGGAVNRGISFLAFSQWRTKQGKPTPTFADLKNLTIDEATEIYNEEYFSKIGFDDLPSGLDYVFANTAIMDGVSGAKRIYTQAQTLSGGDTFETCLAMMLVQACQKMHSKSVGRYGAGWSDRLLRVAHRASTMIGH